MELFVTSVMSMVDNGTISVADGILLLLVLGVLGILGTVGAKTLAATTMFLNDHRNKMLELTQYSAKMLEESDKRFSSCMEKHYEYVQAKCSEIDSKLVGISKEAEDINNEVCQIKEHTLRLTIKAGN